jgi:hypothetical protein
MALTAEANVNLENWVIPTGQVSCPAPGSLEQLPSASPIPSRRRSTGPRRADPGAEAGTYLKNDLRTVRPSLVVVVPNRVSRVEDLADRFRGRPPLQRAGGAAHWVQGTSDRARQQSASKVLLCRDEGTSPPAY